MWNGGMFLLWNRIPEIFYENRECRLDPLPKITYAHLTPYSIMNVQLAAQVLSSTVSNVLRTMLQLILQKLQTSVQ